MFILAFGWIVVLHSPPARARLESMLSSTGLNRSTTQDGLATAVKSVLDAAESQLSILHDPASEMSAESTASAPFAARAAPGGSQEKMAAATAIPIRPARAL